MLYLSLPDPNYRIKGSRDPLGFQPVWQRLGRTIIQYLSTVSVNVRDFQVMSFAYYFYGDDDPKQFLDFFYKWEQLCAYARGHTDFFFYVYNRPIVQEPFLGRFKAFLDDYRNEAAHTGQLTKSDAEQCRQDVMWIVMEMVAAEY